MSLTSLKPGDQIEIIAPASRCSDAELQSLQTLLESWQLKCVINPHIFGDDLLCANTDEQRFLQLKSALQNPQNKAVICARGGYGSLRLLPELATLPKMSPKWFVGMSDITTLHLFLQQQWQWPVLHAALSPDRFSKESIAKVRAVLFGETKEIAFAAQPLNQAARDLHVLEGCITGGNLSLVQTSLGTSNHIQTVERFVFLEEVKERGYQVDRMLAHLLQAGVFATAKAVILGDFTEGDEPNGLNLVPPVLNRFAELLPIPVVKIEGIGHGHINNPMPLGMPAQLHLLQRDDLALQIQL